MQPDDLFFGILLSLVPTALICAALRFHLKRKQPLSPIRLYLFRAGLIVGCSGLLAFACYLFGSLSDSDGRVGSYFNARQDLIYLTAFSTALTTVVFSFFGRRAARLLLLAAGVVLVCLLQLAFVAYND